MLYLWKGRRTLQVSDMQNTLVSVTIYRYFRRLYFLWIVDIILHVTFVKNYRIIECKNRKATVKYVNLLY